MRIRTALLVVFCGVIPLIGVLRAQKPFKEWPAIKYVDFPLPPDYQKEAEWVRARLDLSVFPGQLGQSGQYG